MPTQAAYRVIVRCAKIDCDVAPYNIAGFVQAVLKAVTLASWPSCEPTARNRQLASTAAREPQAAKPPRCQCLLENCAASCRPQPDCIIVAAQIGAVEALGRCPLWVKSRHCGRFGYVRFAPDSDRLADVP